MTQRSFILVFSILKTLIGKSINVDNISYNTFYKDYETLALLCQNLKLPYLLCSFAVYLPPKTIKSEEMPGKMSTKRQRKQTVAVYKYILYLVPKPSPFFAITLQTLGYKWQLHYQLTCLTFIIFLLSFKYLFDYKVINFGYTSGFESNDENLL